MSTVVEADPEQRLPRRVTPARVLVAIVVIGSIALWTYAFVFAPRKALNRIADQSWAASAEAACASTQAAIAGLPPASTAHTPQERAKVLDQANTLLEHLVTTLGATDPQGSARDVSFVHQWVADYRTYLNDRRAYADVLRAGSDARFSVTAYKGAPLTERMDVFARTNRMPSCAVPLDV